MAIAKLPEEVRSAVRNGVTITSTAQCVAELVYNSLDAEADSVIIHLDVPQYKLQVFDNGSGITFENLKQCGIRYNTSKCRSLSDIQSNLKNYGYRGEALSSILASSGTVIILTRPRNEGHTYCKTFSNGKPHHPSRAITSRTCSGTTVTVQDFMYNAPVRQQRIKPNIDVEEIRLQVEGLALAHPNVSFTIQDESDSSTILSVARSQSTLETFSKLYGDDITNHLCPIGPLNSGNHKIYGFISKSSHHNKRLQFIFVNGKLVKRTKVHKLINMIMRKSDVLRGSGPWQELPLPERVRDFLWVSPTKKRDRYCVFLINIDCPLTEYDITLDPDKTLIEFREWDSLLESIEKLVKDFLKRHNLACVTSDPERGESDEESPSSLLGEIERLDEEESVVHKLDRFKHDMIKQGEVKTFTSRTICSIPAKRCISSQKKSTNLKNPKSPARDGKPFDKKGEIESTLTPNQTDIFNNPVENHLGQKIPKLVCSTNSQSVGDKNPNASLISVSGESKRETSEHNSSTRGNSSLSKFRNLFRQVEMLQKKTPADIQHIEIKEPPPIIKRKVPLEHRIKAVIEPEQMKSYHPKPVVTNNLMNTEKNEKSLRHCPFNDSNIDEKLLSFNKDAKYFPVAQSNDKTCKHSHYFKKNYPTTSISTQTVSDPISLELQPEEQIKLKPKELDKPNLKNISARMKKLKKSLTLAIEPPLLKNNLKDKDSSNILNVQSLNEVDCFTSGHVSDGITLTESSKESSVKEVNCNFLSSDDLICALGDKHETSESDAVTELKNDVNLISSHCVTTRSTKSLTAVTDSMGNIVSDKPGQGLRKDFAVYDVISQVEKAQIYINQPQMTNHFAFDSSETVWNSLIPSIIYENFPKNVPDQSSALQERRKKSLEEVLSMAELSHNVFQSDTNAVLTTFSHCDAMNEIEKNGNTTLYRTKVASATYDNDVATEMKKHSDASPGEKTVVKKYDCFKVSQKRSSNSDEEMNCIIKKRYMETTLDSDQHNNFMLDKVDLTECMDRISHILPNNNDVNEHSLDSVYDVILNKIPKDRECIDNKSLANEDPDDYDMIDMEKISSAGSDNSKINNGLQENNDKKSTFVDDDLAKERTFEMFARQPFLPKGLSPIMTKDSAKFITLGKSNTQDHLSPLSGNSFSLASGKKITMGDTFPIQSTSSKESTSEMNAGNDTNETGFISSYLSEMENKKYLAECKVLSAYDSSQKSIMKIFNLIYPCTFSKKVLARFKMLGKLDDKFIVAQINMEKSIGSGTIVLFDQHAVHERIRLEKLMKEYITVHKEEGDFNSTYIKYKAVSMVPPFEIATSGSEFRLMEKFTKHFDRLGLGFERSSGNEHKDDDVVIRITAIPACLSSKDAKELGPLGLKERIHALIREQAESLVITRGLGTSSPGVLRDAINMEACRGAVKFGDTLSDHQCRWLLRNLAKCDSPFQCAHGRPSMYPIATISHLDKHWGEIEQEKPHIWKLKELMELDH